MNKEEVHFCLLCQKPITLKEKKENPSFCFSCLFLLQNRGAFRCQSCGRIGYLTKDAQKELQKYTSIDLSAPGIVVLLPICRGCLQSKLNSLFGPLQIENFEVKIISFKELLSHSQS
jgi:hypothetical protein